MNPGTALRGARGAGLFDGLEQAFACCTIRRSSSASPPSARRKGVEALSIVIPSQYVMRVAQADPHARRLQGPEDPRAGSPLQIEPLKRLGASPLSMPFGECCPRCKPTIDGVWAGTTLHRAQVYDIAKTMTYLPSHWAATVRWQSNYMKSLGRELEK